jgi:hypothetical protein
LISSGPADVSTDSTSYIVVLAAVATRSGADATADTLTRVRRWHFTPPEKENPAGLAHTDLISAINRCYGQRRSDGYDWSLEM